MRIFRWILAIAAALVLLVVAALLIGTLLVKPDRYKGELERAAVRLTGRPLVIEGHLELSWFPWLGVRTGPARLENPPGESGPDLIDWRAAQVKIRLLPLLLHRRIELSRIRLRGAQLHLRLDARGRGNWQSLIAHLRPTGSPPRASAAPAASARAFPAIAGLDLSDGSLDFSDERTGTRFSISAWRLKIGAVRSGRPVSVSTRFVLHAHRLPAAGIPVEFAARALTLQSESSAGAAPELLLRIAQATARGSATVSRQDGQLVASGSLSAKVPSVRALLATLGVHAPLPPDPNTLGALSLDCRWSYRDGAIALEPLSATLDATRLTGWIDRSGGPHPLWRFMLRGNEIDFTHYLPSSVKPGKPFELPMHALEALRAQGTVELGRAQFGAATMHDIRLQVE